MLRLFPGYTVGRNVAIAVLYRSRVADSPATETVLRYLSSEIEWSLIAVSEEWRRSLEVIWRKRGGAQLS